MSLIMRFEGAGVTRCQQSNPKEGKQPVLYVTISDGVNELDVSASLLTRDKIMPHLMEKGNIVLLCTSRIYSGANGSKNLINIEDFQWSPVEVVKK